jgi:hypothetical protein
MVSTTALRTSIRKPSGGSENSWQLEEETVSTGYVPYGDNITVKSRGGTCGILRLWRLV